MRIVNVSTCSVTQCAACGGDHAHIPLYNAISGPGIDVPEGGTRAIICPSLDYTVVLVDASHITEEGEAS